VRPDQYRVVQAVIKSGNDSDVERRAVEALIAEVTTLLAEGWELAGPLVAGPPISPRGYYYLYQPMIKRGEGG
jgi:hypothetical protein